MYKNSVRGAKSVSDGPIYLFGLFTIGPKFSGSLHSYSWPSFGSKGQIVVDRIDCFGFCTTTFCWFQLPHDEFGWFCISSNGRILLNNLVVGVGFCCCPIAKPCETDCSCSQNDDRVSYLNFYIANECVLVPVTGQSEQDDRPMGTLREAFDEYDIVDIDRNILGEGGVVFIASHSRYRKLWLPNANQPPKLPLTPNPGMLDRKLIFLCISDGLERF